MDKLTLAAFIVAGITIVSIVISLVLEKINKRGGNNESKEGKRDKM